MKNKIKKIITTTLLSAVTASVVGSTANAISQNLKNENSSAVSTHTQECKHKYLAPTKKIGKIVETNTIVPYNAFNSTNNYDYLTQTTNENLEENISSSPAEMSGSFHIFFLTNTPSITFTSGENNENQPTNSYNSRNLNNNKINSLITKKSILMIYLNELYSNNISLESSDKTELKNIIDNYKSTNTKSASPYFNRNIDAEISAIDSIISILENKLSSGSNFYQNKLFNMQSQNSNITEVSEGSSNQDIASFISSSFNMSNSINNQAISNSTSSNQTRMLEQNNQNIFSNTNNTQPSNTQNETNNQITNSQSNSQINRNNTNRRRFRNNQTNPINTSNTRETANQNNITQSQRTEQTNQSSILRRNNMSNQNTNNTENNISRANRSSNSLKNEEYSPSSNTLIGERHTASRVPYTDNFHV